MSEERELRVWEEYSGKFTLRLPRTLHRQLSLRAEVEKVSLNQFILYLLGYRLGQGSRGH